MGLTLWIDENSFAASLIEKVFKKRGLGFYHLQTPQDFSYLVHDLGPELIVLDAETVRKHQDAFERQYQASPGMQETKYVVIGSWEGLDFVQNKCGLLERKMDPFKVPEKLISLLEECH